MQSQNLLFFSTPNRLQNIIVAFSVLSTVQFSYSYYINPINRIKNQLLVIVVVRLVEDVSLVRDPT